MVANIYTMKFLICWIILSGLESVSAFLFGRHHFTRNGRNNGCMSSNPPPNKPPSTKSSSHDFSHNDDSQSTNFLFMGGLLSEDSMTDNGEICDENDKISAISIRGGNAVFRKNDNFDAIARGTRTTLKSSLLYWSDFCQSAKELIVSPFRYIHSSINTLSPSRRKKMEQNEEEAKIIHDLQTVIVSEISAPNATTLPKDVLLSAARKSGLLGGTLKPDAVRECAQLLKQWYVKQGFVLNAMTGATLVPEKNAAVLSIQEPAVSNIPVGITFAKELVVDPESNEPMTYREYRQYHHRRKTNKHNILQRKDMNTTIVETTGRTRPYVLANALKLQPGENFCWNQQRWDHIRSSGIFSRVLRASPERMRDGSVQLHIIAQEAPPRNLEYGVSRSLYTGSWEGELDFLHGNILGGGETLGLAVRRGAQDPEPSIRLKFQDDKFGLEGGYHVELFNDYVAVDALTSTDSAYNLVDQSSNENSVSNDNINHNRQGNIIDSSLDDGALISRKGTTIRLRDPNFVPFFSRSSISTSLERTSTRTGKHEEIGSVTLDLGPFQRSLPFQARTNLLTSYTVGARLYEGGMNSWHRHFLPYSSALATSRQIIPLSYGYGVEDDQHRPVQLAFQHSLMTSTTNLPRHEANAAGIAARVRGYPFFSNGPVGKYVVGTAELRVPVNLPFEQVVQDANIIFFGDWMYGERRVNRADSFVRKASIGIGLRKTVQGLPLKYDICLTEDRKLGGFFSLGLDFDV